MRNLHGHFPKDFGGFRTMPPDSNLLPDYSERFGVEGYNQTVQQEAYNFYKTCKDKLRLVLGTNLIFSPNFWPTPPFHRVI